MCIRDSLERLLVTIEEEMVVVSGGAHRQPGLAGAHPFLFQLDRPCRHALADAHRQGAGIEVDVVEPELAQFADPNPGLDEQRQDAEVTGMGTCLLYTSPSPRDRTRSRMPSS